MNCGKKANICNFINTSNEEGGNGVEGGGQLAELATWREGNHCELVRFVSDFNSRLENL
jgi:hypothetical protein